MPTPVPASLPNPPAPAAAGAPTPKARTSWPAIGITFGILLLISLALAPWRPRSSQDDRHWFEEVKEDPALVRMVGAPASLGRLGMPVRSAQGPVPLHILAYPVRGPQGKAVLYYIKVDFEGERLLHRIELSDALGAPRSTLLFTDALADRGWEHADAGDLDKAFAAFELALRLNPRDLWAYNNRALTYASAGKFDSAYEDLEQALLIAPEEAALYLSRGQVLALDQNDRGAVQDLEHAIALAPWDPDAYCLLAVLYDMAGLRGQSSIARDRLEVARQVYGIPASDLAEAEEFGKDFRDSLESSMDEQ